uniref:Uncharacterized protein n=1 Tax=Knipowitschia caucasica TaxID=637954 RepID=A0AAV2MHT5_KNICA
MSTATLRMRNWRSGLTSSYWSFPAEKVNAERVTEISHRVSTLAPRRNVLSGESRPLHGGKGNQAPRPDPPVPVGTTPGYSWIRIACFLQVSCALFVAFGPQPRVKSSQKATELLTILCHFVILRESFSNEPGKVRSVQLQAFARPTGTSRDARLKIQQKLFLSKSLIEFFLHPFKITLHRRGQAVPQQKRCTIQPGGQQSG